LDAYVGELIVAESMERRGIGALLIRAGSFGQRSADSNI
jgi:hypothetical protein